jgi:uncharacterized damage-inducible protein DinB
MLEQRIGELDLSNPLLYDKQIYGTLINFHVDMPSAMVFSEGSRNTSVEICNCKGLGVEMDAKSSKTQLIDQLVEEHERLKTVLSGLSLSQWNEPGVSGTWSVKDVLAHIIADEQNILQALEFALRGEPLSREYRDLDAFNQRVIEDYRSVPVGDIQNMWDQSYEKVISAVYQLKEDDFSPASSITRAIGASIKDTVGDKTYEHYAEHRAQIENWLASKQPPG